MSMCVTEMAAPGTPGTDGADHTGKETWLSECRSEEGNAALSKLALRRLKEDAAEKRRKQGSGVDIIMVSTVWVRHDRNETTERWALRKAKEESREAYKDVFGEEFLGRIECKITSDRGKALVDMTVEARASRLYIASHHRFGKFPSQHAKHCINTLPKLHSCSVVQVIEGRRASDAPNVHIHPVCRSLSRLPHVTDPAKDTVWPLPKAASEPAPPGSLPMGPSFRHTPPPALHDDPRGSLSSQSWPMPAPIAAGKKASHVHPLPCSSNGADGGQAHVAAAQLSPSSLGSGGGSREQHQSLYPVVGQPLPQGFVSLHPQGAVASPAGDVPNGGGSIELDLIDLSGDTWPPQGGAAPLPLVSHGERRASGADGSRTPPGRAAAASNAARESSIYPAIAQFPLVDVPLGAAAHGLASRRMDPAPHSPILGAQQAGAHLITSFRLATSAPASASYSGPSAALLDEMAAGSPHGEGLAQPEHRTEGAAGAMGGKEPPPGDDVVQPNHMVNGAAAGDGHTAGWPPPSIGYLRINDGAGPLEQSPSLPATPGGEPALASAYGFHAANRCWSAPIGRMGAVPPPDHLATPQPAREPGANEAAKDDAGPRRRSGKEEASWKVPQQPGRGPDRAPQGELQQEKGSSLGAKNVKHYPASVVRVACNDFADDRIIGQGGFGVVYRGEIQCTDVAIKKLKREDTHRHELALRKLVAQFHKEVDLHGRIHHPNVVILMGCCEDPPCLVYEYMCNGSLEDRLKRVNNSRPLPWHIRFNNVREICRALILLHEQEPAITHLDLKPANILLGKDFSAKLGDVGLAQLMDLDSAQSFKQHSQQQGTYGYACPEYLTKGDYGTRTDMHGLGVIFWDILGGLGYRSDGGGELEKAAKQKKAQRGPLIRRIEAAVEERQNAKQLPQMVMELCSMDLSQGSWPTDVAVKVARLAVECTRYERARRPFSQEVARRLELLVGRVEKERREPPPQFLCCITKEVMREPVVAADGQSYERAAIEEWLRKNNTSPYTREVIAERGLHPNHQLRSLISEWKLEQQVLGLQEQHR